MTSRLIPRALRATEYAATSLAEMLQRRGSAFFTVIVMRGIRANPTIDLTKMGTAVPAKIIRIRDP
jgi:hypothetical protein